MYITQSNIYDGALYCENSKSLSIFTKKLHRRYSLGFLVRLCSLKTLQTLYFFKVYYIIRLLKSPIFFKVLLLIHQRKFYSHVATHMMCPGSFISLTSFSCFFKPIMIFAVDINCYLDLISANYMY